jgi:hypothetical protein
LIAPAAGVQRDHLGLRGRSAQGVHRTPWGNFFVQRDDWLEHAFRSSAQADNRAMTSLIGPRQLVRDRA